MAIGLNGPENDELTGQVLLHYEVIGRLGEGGMGVVYRALDLKLKRTVALKFLPASQALTEEARQRFMREAMASSALDDTNIGTLHAIEETSDHQLFLVMACYEGPTLRDKMEQGPLPAEEAVPLALQIARGLGEAHKHGIVHRDIKPGNLILNAQGVLKILDFGLAKLHDSPELTLPGSTLGTAAYMAPEQALGKPTDRRADLWACGVVLHEMLTGRKLFRGSDLRSTIYAVISKEPEPIPGLPGPLDRVLRKALQKDPQLRYQTAAEMIADLEAARGLKFQASPAGIVAGSNEAGELTAPLVSQAVAARGKSARPWMAFSAAILLVGVLIGGWMLHRRSSMSGSSGLRVAVLPLVVNSEDSRATASLQALGDGLRGRLIESLGNLEGSNKGLLIIPAAQIAAQHVTGPAEARSALGSDIAVAGSLAQSGNKLRLVLTAVNTATGKAGKEEIIEGSGANLPELSQRLTQISAKMLGLKTLSAEQGEQGLEGLAPAVAGAYLASLGYLGRSDAPGNLDAAIAGFQQVAAASPDFALAYSGLADCYRRRYETTKDAAALALADQNISRAAQIDPQSTAVMLSRGQVRLLQGRYSEAVGDFERVLSLDGRSDGAYRGLAKAYAATGLPDKAQDAWLQAIALRPNSVDGYNQLGKFQLGLSKYDQAAGNFRKALNLAPDNANLMSNLGVALLYSGALDESRRMFQQSIHLAPSYASYTNLGDLDLKQGRYSDAAADYEKALEINKSDYQVWSDLAVAYSRTPGQSERAKDGFLQAAKLCRQALKANPNDPIMLSDLAMFVASEGAERQEPLELIEKALALAPQDTYVQFNAAETYESLGYRKEALDWVGKLVAAGYPLDDINESPVLAELVKDPRFKSIVQSRKK